MSSENYIYKNAPQLTAALIDAPNSVTIAGRGMGKSSHILAPKAFKMIQSMPCSTIVNVAASYQQHLVRTLPAIIQGWEEMGLKEGVHFFVGQYAPSKLGWNKPKRRPKEHKYTIHWYNGAIMQLVATSVRGSANGMDIDGLIGDEIKFVNEPQLKEEIYPAMRGNTEKFGYNPAAGRYHTQHHNVCFTTDMPTDPQSLWLLDYEQRMDSKRCDVIKALSIKLELLRTKYYYSDNKHTKGKYLTKINALHEKLAVLRLGSVEANIPKAVFYQEASSLENIHILKKSYFLTQMEDLNLHEFKTSILNHKVKKVGASFYPLLSESRHAYEDFNQDFLNTIDYKTYVPDCRQDADCISTLPLHMSGDYGGSFNGLNVGQEHGHIFSMINTFHGLFSVELDAPVMEFKKYYRHHKNKYVYLYYDHTHIGKGGLSSDSYKDRIMKLLSKSDEYGSWRVKPIYIGMTSSYSHRHELWKKVCLADHSSGYTFRFHRIHCEDWKDSCLLAGTKTTVKGLEKDKSSEKKKPGEHKWPVPQNKATHYSDGGDCLIDGFLNHYLIKKNKGPVMV
ncbi:MAG: hypothetical protein ACRBFS_22825 [Aureispira sp.]